MAAHESRIENDSNTYFVGSRLGGLLDLQGLLARGKVRPKKWLLFFLILNLLGVPEIIYLCRNKRKSGELSGDNRIK